ncbi:MAG: peptide chain release factor 2 [Candidatus Wildermuthbacteria bacterium RIFCSPHIGHO2_02_FULL_48_16]|uniref:Peptide chain release factor 2 n=1 Tax=Candidatus Wildermuthbacteria bacterium RIFCSPHIGHO2_02_FULL_48_16 TaxID=1802453 RepID=A0A1G2R756_9BACT|nr:MAG: peptide chain release factor 2 [Candidatus Wildermuthbacteria bacterium RIFCSPHIGHO2_02_FULL_48_16]
MRKEQEKPGFWDDSEKAGFLSKELADLEESLQGFRSLEKDLKDLAELAELAGVAEVEALENRLKQEESKLFLSGKYDKGNAILTVTPGAGGEDAADWATMLFRMYQRFCERKGWKTSILEPLSMEIKGKFAYGLLKRENGVHRLVRMSPFSAKKLRHTSFAAVEVLPQISAGDAEVEIRPEDISVEFARSSGPGGQNVNKRETAVRIVHIPTGIAVESQATRTQQQNKERALEILAAKLYHIQELEREKEVAKLKGKAMPIEWGSQIRSYVLHPYQMVKDHRTEQETTDTQGVLDGKLDDFIDAEISIN